MCSASIPSTQQVLQGNTDIRAWIREFECSGDRAEAAGYWPCDYNSRGACGVDVGNGLVVELYGPDRFAIIVDECHH